MEIYIYRESEFNTKSVKEREREKFYSKSLHLYFNRKEATTTTTLLLVFLHNRALRKEKQSIKMAHN